METLTGKKNQEFLEAAAAVYAWVSASDGTPNEKEISGFIAFLEDLDYIDEISDNDFNDIYINILSNFEKDFEYGLSIAKNRINKFIGNEQISKDLIRVARKALIADEAYDDREENAISELSQMLNIEESTIN